MRKLYLGDGDTQFKFSDTTTTIHLTAFDDSTPATLTEDAKVRIKNDSGYLLEISAGTKDNHAIITSGQLNQLPVGSYWVELWDTVNGGTAIYPSNGFVSLQINENITGLSGKLVSSITLDDFMQQFNGLSQQLKQQVADAIANHIKGDKGERGNTVFKSSFDDIPNWKGYFWSDLSPSVSVDNPPKIGDTVITPSGNIFQITTLYVGGSSNGGGTFGVGNVLGNIRGPQGDKGENGKDGNAWKVIDDSATDLNTLVTDGRYWLKATMTNAPNVGWGYMFVDAADPIRVLQRWVGDSQSDLYLRMLNDKDWTPWKKVSYSAV